VLCEKAAIVTLPPPWPPPSGVLVEPPSDPEAATLTVKSLVEAPEVNLTAGSSNSRVWAEIPE
jgi:hypothetical protein